MQCVLSVCSNTVRTRAQVQARLADARERVVGPLAAASERLRHIGAPAAPSPGSPALPRPNPSSSGALSATQPLTGLPAEDTSDSWFSSALRPLRSLLSAAASSPDSETKPSGMSSGAQQQGSLQSEQTADSWLGSALWSLRSLAAPAPPDPGRAALQSPSSPAAPSSKPGQAGQQAAAAGSSSSSPFSRFGGALQPLRGLVGLSERRGEPQAAAGGGPPVEQPAGGAVTEDGSWLGGRLRPLRQVRAKLLVLLISHSHLVAACLLLVFYLLAMLRDQCVCQPCGLWRCPCLKLQRSVK